MAVEADLDRASSEAGNSKKAGQARTRTLDRWLARESKFRDPAANKTAAPVKKQGDSKTGAVSSDQDGPVVL